jgi:hypothetical protein
VKHLAVLTALVAFLVTCAVSPSGAFAVSTEFSVEERAIIDRAVARWNEIAVPQFATYPSDEAQVGCRHCVYRIVIDSDLWRALDAKYEGLLGIYEPAFDRIGIVWPLEPAVLELVALHEFGHAHGLVHTEDPAIMFFSVGSAVDFTDIDLAECRRVFACVAD